MNIIYSLFHKNKNATLFLNRLLAFKIRYHFWINNVKYKVRKKGLLVKEAGLAQDSQYLRIHIFNQHHNQQL